MTDQSDISVKFQFSVSRGHQGSSPSLWIVSEKMFLQDRKEGSF